jgi:hypothetical protein
MASDRARSESAARRTTASADACEAFDDVRITATVSPDDAAHVARRTEAHTRRTVTRRIRGDGTAATRDSP